ncbi:MAG: C39 family peptidase [Mycobacterium sp.]|nr:C39 family peptidase [Mycobacterium sp.]
MVAASGVALGLSSPADAASGTMYGDPTAAAQWWRHQEYDDCVIMSSADVIGQVTGKEPSEQAIVKKAQSTPSTRHSGSIYIKPANQKDPNTGMGTSMLDVPTLLAQYNVNAVASDKEYSAKTGVPAGIEGLEQLLSGGHKIIVEVNGEMIWNQPIENKDENGNPEGDHAVVVTGIDTANNIVHLNDSGIKTGRDEQISMQLFMKSWDTAGEMVVVTT